MTSDELIADIIAREGGYTEDTRDHGNGNKGATNFGITSVTLGEWRRMGRPATREEVKNLTVAEATEIYRRRYAQPFEIVPYDELRASLIDFGVNSGPVAAIKALQTALGVPVDGVLGPRTREALGVVPWRLVNQAVVAQRLKHIVAAVEEDKEQKAFLWGWCQRLVRCL